MSIFPTKILLATDGSGEAANPYVDVVELAGDEAVTPRLDAELKRQFERQAREVLDAEAERVRAAGGAVAQAHLSMGKADHEIVGFAEEIGAGLIVMGSKGRGGIRRALMGSVSASVVRHAHCPVMVVRDDEHGRDDLPGRILLAVDGSEEASAAAQTALELAER